MPRPPGLLSTIIVWPRPGCIASARMRAITSMLPPAGAGTTMRIGLSGQVWAAARVAAAHRHAARAIRRELMIMNVSLCE